MISLNVLNEKGGILIDHTLILTENLSWINNAKDIPYFNYGAEDHSAEMIVFFKEEKYKRREYIKKDLDVISKNFMVVVPLVEHYFIAAKRRSTFILDWIA